MNIAQNSSQNGVSINHLVAISKARKNSFQAYFIKKNLDLISLVWLQIPKAVNTSDNHSFFTSNNH